MAKMTFTVDEQTAGIIRALAARKKKPQSSIVREAVAVYARQEDKLDKDERVRRLRVLDDLAARPGTRRQVDVDKELREIRRARQVGWRRPAE